MSNRFNHKREKEKKVLADSCKDFFSTCEDLVVRVSEVLFFGFEQKEKQSQRANSADEH